MANTKREKLFTEFPPVPTEKWEEVITADLKGADYERKLVWRTGEGFNVRPYYRAENLEGIRFLGSQAGEFPYVRGTRSHNRWRVHQTVEVKCPREANAEALKLLNSGVDSLGFSIAKEGFTAEELDQLLAGISIPAIEMVFCGAQTGSIAELVIAKLEKEGTASEAHVAFSIDPLVKGLSQKGDFCSPNGEKCFAKIASLIEKTREYKHIRIVTVSAGIFSNAGSTIVEELAFALSAGNDYIAHLTDAGVDAELAARKLRFSFSVTSNYFLEIAKFRAARMLWANIVKGYNPSKNCACKMHIHARTADWNQTVYDPYVNMLRGTTEAMSATIAGVHSLEVTPFDAAFEDPTEFSKRIARNVELLLKNESHFDQVDRRRLVLRGEPHAVPVIARLKLFLEIEEKGGYAEAYGSRFIQERVEASAAGTERPIATRRQTLRGAIKFPAFTEVATKEITAEAVTRPAAEGNVLTPYRGATHAFEAKSAWTARAKPRPGVVLHLRQPGDGPRPPVLVQLLRLRRNPRAGPALLRSRDRGGRECAESKPRSVVVRWTAITQRPHRGEGAARQRKPILVITRRSRVRQMEAQGHHELHREVRHLGTQFVLKKWASDRRELNFQT